MKVVAIIPARAGSKRVPGKNLLSIAGRPLLAYSIGHALESKLISEVIVSTDGDAIARVAENEGAKVVMRPADLSTDLATSESALLHVLDERNRFGMDDPDLVVFLQCTSPVRASGDIDAAIERLLQASADSLFSACEDKRLYWQRTSHGELNSMNYDFKTRRREQDMSAMYQENGSIYVFKASLLRASGNRLGGHIALYEMGYWSSFQVDTPEDVELIEWLMKTKECEGRSL